MLSQRLRRCHNTETTLGWCLEEKPWRRELARVSPITANTRRLANVVSMLAQRLRRWPKIKTTFAQSVWWYGPSSATFISHYPSNTIHWWCWADVVDGGQHWPNIDSTSSVCWVAVLSYLILVVLHVVLTEWRDWNSATPDILRLHSTNPVVPSKTPCLKIIIESVIFRLQAIFSSVFNSVRF